MDIVELLKTKKTDEKLSVSKISKLTGVKEQRIKDWFHKGSKPNYEDGEKIKAWLNGINQNDQKPEPSLVRNDEEVTELKGDVKTLFKELLEIRNRLDALEKKEIAELLNSVKKKH